MLRLAFDFIITWRETRTRPNAYQKTNHLSIFIECLQRTGQAIQIQIEGKNN